MSVLPSPSIQLARSLPVPTEDLPAMSPFDLFRSQIESNSIEAAVDAMKRLNVVVTATGVEQTQKTILPYLQQIAMAQPQHPDELLLVMGQQLMGITDFLGPNSILDLLPMLERLAAVEETVVRDQAVAVIVHLVEAAETSKIYDVSSWMGVAKRLASADWFTAKVSAAGAIPSILKLVIAKKGSVDHQQELLSLFETLSMDETPMVRRAAAKHLGKLLKEAGFNNKDSAKQLVTLAHDEQDSVRLLAVAALADVGTGYGDQPQWTIQNWLQVVRDGSTDMSWRVRNSLAKNFSDVATNLGIQKDPKYKTEQSLVMSCFVALLTDVEAEVRAAATGHLARMVAWGGPIHFTDHLQPLLSPLADDVVMEVRSKCALALMDIAHGGALEDSVILQSFGPLLESFLQDEFQEVQLQVLTNLHKISHLLPGLSGVVSNLLQMAKAANWRVREAIAQLLPHLAEARGLDFFASVLLEPAWLTLLLDSVATVRNAIVQGMALLLHVTGDEWIMQTLLPHHVRIYNQHENSYLIRITILNAHVETAVASKSGPLWNELMTQILRGLTDNVPNVRMVTAHGLARIVEEGDAAFVQAKIRPALEKRLQDDEDEDCRYACQRALERIK